MTTSSTVTLAGRALQPNQHVCAFFNSREEEYRVLLPFFREGMERGDRCFNVIDPKARDTHRARLGEGGIPVDQAEASGALELCPWEQAYLLEGRFDIDRMIGLCHALFSQSRARGHGVTRLWANMEWGLEDAPGVHDIVAYESRLNEVLPSFEGVVGICTYDLSKFSAPMIMDILRTHPMVILGGILQENPFYIPPQDFVRQRQ